MPVAFRNNGEFSVQFGNFRWASNLNGPDGHLFFFLCWEIYWAKLTRTLVYFVETNKIVVKNPCLFCRN